MRPVVNGINIQRDPGRSGGLVKPSTTSIGSAPFGQRLLLSIVLGNAARWQTTSPRCSGSTATSTSAEAISEHSCRYRRRRIPTTGGPSGPRLRPSPHGPRRLERLIMAKEELMQFKGLVIEALPDAHFRVQLDVGHEIVAYTAAE